MRASELMEWLGGVDPDAEVALTARFPGLDGWEVTSWAVSPAEAEGSPCLEMEVHGADFDYPAPSRALLRELPPLLEGLRDAEASGWL